MMGGGGACFMHGEWMEPSQHAGGSRGVEVVVELCRVGKNEW